MVYHGQIKNGTVVLNQPTVLPEGAAVRIEVLANVEEEHRGTGPTLLDRLGPIVGAAKGLPADAAANVDKYLYGPTEQ